MPELPEVETVLRTLENNIKGCKIIDIIIKYPNIIEDDLNTFRNKIINKTFTNFKRRGKYLLFELDDVTFVSHLRMEGKYFIKAKDEVLTKHDHVSFILDNDKQLIYNDVRKFGRMSLTLKDERYYNFHNLGLEPFWPEFTSDYVFDYLSKSKTVIKTELLNQSFIAGIGNIYADEILYLCKLYPALKANKVSYQDCVNIVKYTKDILTQAIKQGGTTIRSYTSSLGVTGLFQLSLNCHTMKKCKICNSYIKKIKVNTRGTYYCANCQKNKIRVAITGGIGCGKSEVKRIIGTKHHVFDCDRYNLELLNEQKVIMKINKVLDKKDDLDILDKTQLTIALFSNLKVKKEVENILHPLIKEEMLKQANENTLFFAEVPLLFEVGYEKYFDYVIVVSASINNIKSRLKTRGYDNNEIARRINNQISLSEKEQKADFIINNNGSIEELEIEIEKVLKQIYDK